MAASLIALHDLRQPFEIVHGCRELWADPQVWEHRVIRPCGTLLPRRCPPSPDSPRRAASRERGFPQKPAEVEEAQN